MEGRLIELDVENYRSLRKVSIPLGPLNVLVGPNGAGKSNVLEVFRFLADVIRTDLGPAMALRGGFEEMVFRGGETSPAFIRIRLKAAWTAHSAAGPDEYELRVEDGLDHSLSREERFQFKGPGRRRRQITIIGESAMVGVAEDQRDGLPVLQRVVGLNGMSSGLSTLPRLSSEEIGEELAAVSTNLASFRVFDVNVESARRPSRFPRGDRESLDDDAANLAAFLLMLRNQSQETWERLVEDATDVLPQLAAVDFDYPSGGAREVVILLRENGLRTPTQLADASYGTIRLLGLLAMLYDPHPPAMTCVEEFDHGLHPQALELLVERLREASARTQFLIATHSPAMADRLKPDELIVCERRSDGSSAIPALPTAKIEEIVARSEDMPLGELWFSGALGGDL